ncbi:glycosyltransferase family 4 protein [Bradyrhizobium jicamae]|uniref:Glycosyltransferase family 4 protein n=1 Tax=Bradyrhizobium jicamae TaxID=280332 RepID=A0ABS5FK30_9BRAD|nr:glycosyltransferase family 4 protein [Bradyrhizobium jicamae]MBR0797147.1 glycosyltransferase family 4 protein [Bradyrhizobium jicamae]MBR0934940.1 glycosyltransferase family 4 protein [Bradyrhizobium jicamae]
MNLRISNNELAAVAGRYPVKILVHDYAGHPFQVDLSRELASRGHQVTHAYFHGDHGPKGRLERSPSDPANLSFKGLSLPRAYDKTSFVRRRFDDVAYGKAVASLIRTLKPDLVISGNTPTESQTSIVKASRKSGAAFVFWVQDFYSIAVTKLLKKKMGTVGAAVGAYYTFLERGQFANSDAIVVITEAFVDVAKKWVDGDEKVFTIENWGTLNEISPLQKNNDWSRRHGLADTFNFLYSGTLALKHNPQLLIDLTKEVKGRANVVVVSQGVGVSDLERAKREQGIDNLILLPLQPFDDLPKVLATSDVTVATIEPDAGMFSVPSKVQSYFCAQRPVLLAAPAENLASQVVRKHGAGLVVDPSDKTGFLRSAVQLMDDDALRVGAAESGRKFALNNYDIMRVTDRFEMVFQYAIRARDARKGTS